MLQFNYFYLSLYLSIFVYMIIKNTKKMFAFVCDGLGVVENVEQIGQKVTFLFFLWLEGYTKNKITQQPKK